MGIEVTLIFLGSGNHTQESEKNIAGIVPHISDQVVKWIVAWEDEGTITKEECFIVQKKSHVVERVNAKLQFVE